MMHEIACNFIAQNEEAQENSEKRLRVKKFMQITDRLYRKIKHSRNSNPRTLPLWKGRGDSK